MKELETAVAGCMMDASPAKPAEREPQALQL